MKRIASRILKCLAPFARIPILHHLFFVAVAVSSLFPSVTHADSLKQPMTFRSAGNGGNCNGCGWTAAQGEIVEDTPAAFETFLRGNHPQGHIVFHSPGGNLGAALKLGAAIRRLELATSIGETVLDGTTPGSLAKKQLPGICVSACAYAFLGGKTRYAERGYGVHQFFNVRKLTEELEVTKDPMHEASPEQSIVGLLTLYVKSMGVDTDLVFVASATAAADVYWLSASELKRFKVDNSGDVQEPWKTEPYRDGAITTTAVRQGGDEPLSLTLFCRKGPSPVPFLLLSKRISGAGWMPDSAGSEGLKKTIFDWSIRFDQSKYADQRPVTDIASVSIAKDGTAYVTLKISPNDVALLTRSRVASVQINQPRAYGYPFYGNFALQGAAPHIDLVMRNCLGSS
jgi:hypothetical protein